MTWRAALLGEPPIKQPTRCGFLDNLQRARVALQVSQDFVAAR